MFRYFWANKSRKSEKLGDPVVEKANKIVLAEEGQKRREGDWLSLFLDLCVLLFTPNLLKFPIISYSNGLS